MWGVCPDWNVTLASLVSRAIQTLLFGPTLFQVLVENLDRIQCENIPHPKMTKVFLRNMLKKGENCIENKKWRKQSLLISMISSNLCDVDKDKAELAQAVRFLFSSVYWPCQFSILSFRAAICYRFLCGDLTPFFNLCLVLVHIYKFEFHPCPMSFIFYHSF